MPYIKSADYSRAARLPISSGELNFAITREIVAFLGAYPGGSLNGFRGRVSKLCNSYINRRGVNYTVMNEVIGVIACAGLEVMRRCGGTLAVEVVTEMLADVGDTLYDDLLAPYEDGKIKENGDVYPAELIV